MSETRYDDEQERERQPVLDDDDANDDDGNGWNFKVYIVIGTKLLLVLAGMGFILGTLARFLYDH